MLQPTTTELHIVLTVWRGNATGYTLRYRPEELSMAERYLAETRENSGGTERLIHARAAGLALATVLRTVHHCTHRRQTLEKQAYVLGQLLTVLISDGWADAEAAERAVSNLRGTLLPAIARATQDPNPKITDMLSQVGEIPDALSNEQSASFWLGYYHRRRGPGRRSERQSRRAQENAWHYRF